MNCFTAMGIARLRFYHDLIEKIHKIYPNDTKIGKDTYGFNTLKTDNDDIKIILEECSERDQFIDKHFKYEKQEYDNYINGVCLYMFQKEQIRANDK